ncbi:hypothetical protein F5884DRAFT_216360 [Xylogone sp. PMI_703]|nr:hypothetical protein F5884DRAFT_216360 [Xylogone sp. PMI_703]
MELTPQSRSPKSPYHYDTSSTQPIYEYPSPAHSDSRYPSTESIRGLGLYSAPMSTASSGGTCGAVPQLQSSTATNWSGVVQQGSTSRSSNSTPNILSAEYDPFAPFPSAIPSPYSHDIYSTHPAEVGIYPVSPVTSSSQRSSFSSAPASDIFSRPGTMHSYSSRVKMEEHPEYIPVPESMILSSAEHSHGLTASAGSYPGNIESVYGEPAHGGWPKLEMAPAPELPSLVSLPSRYHRRSEGHEDRAAGPHDHRRTPSTIARTRPPRKLTTKEEANFQCQVNGCGKLFSRSYNFKAHMETHDASREYPFPCPIEDCTKKFVRKTDLQRHHQSVHMKQRNHKCDYCGRYFARKDTLRRHMEDGCSKRFDIETVDFRPQSYGSSSIKAASGRPNPPTHPYHAPAQYSPPQAGSTPAASRAYGERPEYIAAENGDSVWNA